jgi:hypothetical protein
MANTLGVTAGSGTFFEFDGRTYHMSPLTLADYGSIVDWLEMRPFERARAKIESLGPVATEAMKTSILAQAEKERIESDVIGGARGEEAKRDMASFEGIGFMLYLSLRKSHTAITREECRAMLTMRTLEQWQAELDRISLLEDTASKKARAPQTAWTGRGFLRGLVARILGRLRK